MAVGLNLKMYLLQDTLHCIYSKTIFFHTLVTAPFFSPANHILYRTKQKRTTRPAHITQGVAFTWLAHELWAAVNARNKAERLLAAVMERPRCETRPGCQRARETVFVFVSVREIKTVGEREWGGEAGCVKMKQSCRQPGQVCVNPRS